MLNEMKQSCIALNFITVRVLMSSRGGGGHDEYQGHLLTCRLITANRGPALPCVCAHDTKNVMSVSYPI